MKFGQVLLLAAVNYVVHGHSVSIETVERLKIIMIEKTWIALRKGVVRTFEQVEFYYQKLAFSFFFLEGSGFLSS